MENKLITTFKEYKEIYQTRLEKHLAEYDDFDEFHFIESELEYFKICFATANVKERQVYIGYDTNAYECYDYRYLNDIENDNNPLLKENQTVKDLIYEFNEIGYNLKTCERLTISFNKIISFLEEKKIILDKVNEYQSNFMQPDATIIARLDAIETPKVDNDKIQQSEKYLFLKETAKEYIEKHETRLQEFLNEFEADKVDYIEKQIEYFESTLYDIDNSEGAHDGYSTTGFDNFSCAYELVMNIGYDKFMYSTKAKLIFLSSQKNIVLPQEKQEPEFTNEFETNQSDVKETKSLLFNGKKLNYAERFIIANEVFSISEKFRTLNISDNDKYQILSYVLGCNIDNARHLMNNTYKAKERKTELLQYLTSLSLNK